MKNAFYLLVCLVLTCCNNRTESSSTESGKTVVSEETPGVSEPGTATTNPAGKVDPAVETPDPPGKVDPAGLTDDDDDYVYVGVFARWNFNSDDHFDGSYDTTHNFFVKCASDIGSKVPRDQIEFQEFGNCDTVLANRIKLFRIKKNGEVNPNGERIKVVDNKAYIERGGSTRTIELDEPTINRIKKATMIRRVQYYQPTEQPKVEKKFIQPKPVLQKEVNKSRKAQ